MRTTVTLDNGLAEDLKRRAAEQRTSVSALIELALRRLFSESVQPSEAPHFQLITVSGEGLQPGMDLDRAAKLVDMEDSMSLLRAGR